MKRLKTLFLLLLFFLYTNQGLAATDEETQDHIKRLEQRIKKLESRPKQPRKKSSSRGSTTATGLSRAFNPAISVNGLFLGTFNSEGNANPNKENQTGLHVQELELRLTGNVDKYFRGDLTLAMPTTDSIEIEEIKVTALLTQSLSFQGGKFFTPFGKHNQLHTHQYAFVDPPLVNEEIFGDDGLNETGMGINYLLPFPFYSELNLQVLDGDNTNVFDGPLNDDFAYLVHSSNLFELSDEWTMETGGSYAYGKNSVAADPYNRTHLAGADLRFKYKPLGKSRYRTFIWQSEFMTSSREQVKTGAYTYLQYQFARRWWAQGRYGYFYEESTKAKKNRWSALLAFTPSEFSSVRVQYNHLNQFAADEYQAFLQLNISFGSHPAHKY